MAHFLAFSCFDRVVQLIQLHPFFGKQIDTTSKILTNIVHTQVNHICSHLGVWGTQFQYLQHHWVCQYNISSPMGEGNVSL